MTVLFDVDDEFVVQIQHSLKSAKSRTDHNKHLQNSVLMLEKLIEKQNTLLDHMITTNAVVSDMNLKEVVYSTAKKYSDMQIMCLDMLKKILHSNDDVLISDLNIFWNIIDLWHYASEKS